MTTPSHCLQCAQRNRRQPATHGRLCQPCATTLDQQLAALVDLAAQAHLAIEPTHVERGSHAPAFESRPPINVDAVDPELAGIELWKGDPTSVVTILEMLEMWEIRIREDRRLAPYGPASLQRPGPPLTSVVTFLRQHLSWMTSSDEFPVADFIDHVTRAFRILSRWNVDKEDPHWGLRCPNEVADGRQCGAWIRWEPGALSAECGQCGREWDVPWLMRLAGDVWLDSDTISHLTGIPRRTIQHWGQRGKVLKRGLLYRLSDVLKLRDGLKVAN